MSMAGRSLGVGSTGGYTMPFESIGACKTNYVTLRREARKHDAQLPKCACCGKILRGMDTRFGNDYTMHFGGDESYPFCSERCAERDADKQAALDTNGEEE